MTRKEMLLLLADIEKTIPVWEWKYGDMNIWPIIKRDIFFMFFNNKEDIVSPIKPRKGRILIRLGKLSSSFFYLLAVKFRKTEKITTLYCGAAAHRVDFESNFINRYFFPFTQLNETKYIQYEYGPVIKSKKYKNNESIIYVNKLHLIFKLFRKFKNKPKLNLFKWNELQYCVLERSGLDLSNYYKRLPVKLDSLMAYADASSLLLKKYCPETITGLCYYNEAMFAMHYMANKMNIENFDVQHGGQGSLHSMYTFANFPIGGSNVLPKTFWCWDQVSAKHIKSWLDSQNYHRVEVNGNPWINFQLEKYSNQEILSKEKIILYTLQERELEEYILKTIKLTPESFVWWIRLHPRMLDAKANIERQLELIGCKDKVEIVKATHYPLPVLLKESFVHISKFSGSIIEAVLVNTPNIIIDEVGVEIYEDYIVSGNAHTVLTKNAEDLLSRILTI
jgi:hypothetical protein